MKKHIAISFALIMLVLATGSKTKAYEGEISLSGAGVACKGSSVWHESRYRIIGRCEGLVYPYETQYEYYTLWGHDVTRDTYVRIDDVDRGYFEGDMNSAFDKVLISAEADGGPRRPSDKTVASGAVSKFAFDKSQVSVVEPKETVQKTDENKVMTVQNGTKTTTTSSNAGSVVGRIITSLLVILLVVVGIVIAGSLLFRSRGSVSH